MLFASTFDWDSNAALRRGWTLGITYGAIDQMQFRIFGNAGNRATAILNNFFADNLNQWTHVVGIFRPSQHARIYVNGVMVAQDATGVPAAIGYQTGTNLRMGTRADDNASWWQGGIDEVRIYDRALSDQEVLDLFNEVLDLYNGL